MKITKFKRYISWNLMSLTGYLCMVIAAVFFVMLFLTGSQLHMREDLDGYFYENIIGHVIKPYFSFYKVQLSWVFLLAFSSLFENYYYVTNGEFGLRMFANNEKFYSVLFVTGLALNFLPLYIMFMTIVQNIVKIFWLW